MLLFRGNFSFYCSFELLGLFSVAFALILFSRDSKKDSSILATLINCFKTDLQRTLHCLVFTSETASFVRYDKTCKLWASLIGLAILNKSLSRVLLFLRFELRPSITFTPLCKIARWLAEKFLALLVN